MAIKAVIFDFDGTVADTNQIVLDSWQHTYKALLGSEEDPEKIISTFGEPLVVSMKTAFPDHDTDYAIKVYHDYQKLHFSDSIRPFEGMDTLIRDLKASGYKTGIVTSRLKKTTIEGLDAFGLSDHVDDIVTCEDTDKHKPLPEPALLSLERLGVSADEAVMIGDSRFDIECAHNAGIRAVLVDWAITTSEEYRTSPDGPDYIMKKPSDIYNIIEKCE